MKRIFSALGIGVAVFAMLSLLVSPVLAGSASYEQGTSRFQYGVYAKVSGEWDDGDTTVFTTSNAWAQVWGATIQLTYFVYGPGISTVYSEVAAKENTYAGDTVHAWAWISPPAYPLTSGGDWEYW